jgi:hypothetical protein
VIIFSLATLGGVLYAPSNYDALIYRIPQALQWLAEKHWYWQEVPDNLVNFAPPGQTWIAAPIILFTKSFRPLFLLNVISFAILPGMVFATFRRIGVRNRVAAHWMYIVPCVFGFALQAASLGNDLLGAMFALSAVGFALRAGESRSARDLYVSFLAIALATSVKTTNLPLMLPVAIAALPTLPLLLAAPIRTIVFASWAALVSFLPTAILNTRYTGDWSGDSENKHKMKMSSPVHAMAGNGLIVLSGALEPPVNWPALWTKIDEGIQSSGVGAQIRERFPRFVIRLGEMPTEEGAGIGIGVTTLLIISLFGPIRSGHSRNCTINSARWVPIAAVFATLFCIAKVGSEGTSRHILSYYPLLIAAVTQLRGNAELTRRRWWRALATGACAMVVLPLILSPARPLWPAIAVLEAVQKKLPNSAGLERALTVYRLYRQRSDAYALLRKHIPHETRLIVYVGSGNDPLAALWQPIGGWRVFELVRRSQLIPQEASAIRGSGTGLLIASSSGVRNRFGVSLEEFANQIGTRRIAQETLLLRASRGLEEFIILELPKTAADQPGG